MAVWIDGIQDADVALLHQHGRGGYASQAIGR